MNKPEEYSLQPSHEVMPPWVQLGMRLISPGINALDIVFPEHQVFAALASLVMTHAKEKSVDPAVFRARMLASADAYEAHAAEFATAAA